MKPYEAYEKAAKQRYGTHELESIIATDAVWSHHYAKYVIKGRWEPGEAIIVTDDYYPYLYAKNVIKGRWEPGEASIATDDWHSYLYAKNVIKGRFPLCEPVISKSVYWEDYLEFIPMTSEEKTFLILKYGAPK